MNLHVYHYGYNENENDSNIDSSHYSLGRVMARAITCILDKKKSRDCC